MRPADTLLESAKILNVRHYFYHDVFLNYESPLRVRHKASVLVVYLGPAMTLGKEEAYLVILIEESYQKKY